ncbi:MAG: hypothetical protein ACRCXX_12810 [Cetobacterium sp.]|uniref:hypothetical protein n=1 Tax=Cetobacterium sp. TaxID=2071632 RepID=UPI003F2AA8B0
MSILNATMRNKEILERESVDFVSIEDLNTNFARFSFKVGDIVKIKDSSKVEYRILSITNRGGLEQIVDEETTYYWNIVDMNVRKFVDSENALTTARDYVLGDVVFCLGKTRAGDGLHTIRIKSNSEVGDGSVAGSDGTFWNIVEDIALTNRLNTMKNNLDTAIASKVSKTDIVQDFGVGGVEKVPSAELFNALYQIVSNLQGGSSLKSKLTVERMLGIDSGVKILNKGAKTIVSDKGFFFAPKLYIEGQLCHSDKYTLDAVGGIITLTDAYSLTEDVPYQIFDEYPSDIKFAIDTVLLLTGSNLKDELVVDDVIKILGDSSRYDGGQHLRIVETTSKLNGVALGNGLFLNEVPNSRLKTTEEKAVYNRRDLLNIVGGLGANGGGREYTFIQDPGQKTAGKFYLDQNTMGIYKCVTNTSSVNNDSSFEKIDLDATTAKLQNLINLDGNIQDKIIFKKYEWGSPVGSTSEITIPIGVSYKKVLHVSITAANGKGPQDFTIHNNNIVMGRNNYWLRPENSGNGYVYLILLV